MVHRILQPLFMVLLLSISFLYGCKNSKQEIVTESKKVETPIEQGLPVERIKIDYDTTQWKEITERSGAVLDMRYATDNNFTKNQIYPCPRCFLRPVMADKILTLQKDIKKKYGMSLKLFDCYRPRPAQQKLWDIVPDARYVTPPDKGSMHNRGLAVDMTLVGKDGKELDMGTEYDFFGQEAYTTNTNLPKHVLKNRKVMTKLMEIHGMKGIRTEWWHFSLKTKKAPLDVWEWECE
ncbi:MAG: D-alanyl-D-alanine dipeptidase [Saprospiraceae bacterium]|jgi:D-alanyl-D-alanine dipeptidase